MKHIRIGFNGLEIPTSENFLVEYGRVEVIGLTAEERQEYDELSKQFEDAPKVDFAKAADLLDPKKKAEIQGRRRYVELDKKLTQSQMTWMSVDVEDTPHTILLIMQEGKLPIYVENMPEEMIKRLMEPQINILQPQVYMQQQPVAVTSVVPQATPVPQAETQKTASPKDRITTALKAITEPNTHNKPWDALVLMDDRNPAEGIWEGEETKQNRLYIMPAKFLGDAWKQVDSVVRVTFGPPQVLWKNKLKDKSHWEITI